MLRRATVDEHKTVFSQFVNNILFLYLTAEAGAAAEGEADSLLRGSPRRDSILGAPDRDPS